MKISSPIEIRIRRAELNDLFKIQNLFVDTIRGICSNDYSEEQIEVWAASVNDKKRWEGFIQSQYFLVAEFKEKIVGFGSLDFKKGDYLDFLYVHNEYLRCGIAKRIFEDLEKESRKCGFETLCADVSITAKPFFKKMGFVVERENLNTMARGIEIVNYFMTKK